MGMIQCSGCNNFIDAKADPDCFCNERDPDSPQWDGARCEVCRKTMEDES